MNNNQDKGFTLVELLIVIVILGILATVTVFAVQGITEKGQDNACNVEQRALETAVEAYYVDQTVQAYPSTLADLTPKFTKTAADEAGTGNATGTWTYVSATGSVSATEGGKCA
ncbi:MAG: prepilin-type N-terminal cleavage/methylation domain-containing protein [Ilumatobacter sp.]|jgi:prepilin-type N-terminal cleavage/methylation domain-containing protein